MEGFNCAKFTEISIQNQKCLVGLDIIAGLSSLWQSFTFLDCLLAKYG